MVTVTVTGVQVGADSLRIQFADGTEMEFGSKDDVRLYALSFDDGQEGETLAKKALLARWIKANPQLTNPSQLQGRSCTVNAEAGQGNVIKVT